MQAALFTRHGVVQSPTQISGPLLELGHRVEFGGEQLAVAQHRLRLAANLRVKHIVQRRRRIDLANDNRFPFHHPPMMERQRRRDGCLADAALAQGKCQRRVELGPDGRL